MVIGIFYIYFFFILRPGKATGETEKQRTLSRIHFNAPNPKVTNKATNIYVNFVTFFHFHMLEIRGPHSPISTNIFKLVHNTINLPFFLAKFEDIWYSKTNDMSHLKS